MPQFWGMSSSCPSWHRHKLDTVSRQFEPCLPMVPLSLWGLGLVVWSKNLEMNNQYFETEYQRLSRLRDYLYVNSLPQIYPSHLPWRRAGPKTSAQSSLINCIASYFSLKFSPPVPAPALGRPPHTVCVQVHLNYVWVQAECLAKKQPAHSSSDLKKGLDQSS